MSNGVPSEPIVSPPVWNQIRTLVLREHLLGLLTYVALAPERSANALLGLTLLTCAMVWSFCDGVLPRTGSYGRGLWVVEGVLLYVGAITAANLFRVAFGQASIGW